MDLLAPTAVEGFQIFQIRSGANIEDSDGYAAFVAGERRFMVSYSISGGTFAGFVQKVRFMCKIITRLLNCTTMYIAIGLKCRL